MDSIRIDKWLWAVRVFKTRAQAAEACRLGKISIDGQPVKASREIREGEVILIKQSPMFKTIKVLEVIKNRISAKLAQEAMEDMTSQEEYDKVKFIRQSHFERRDFGAGRPTKKERRDIDSLKKNR